MKKFAVFDIDGTLVRWQLYHAVVDELAKSGALGTDVHEKILRARMQWKRRENSSSFAVYESELIKLFEKGIANLKPDQFDSVTKEIIEEYKDQVYTFTRGLIKKLKKEGYFLLAISGSHQELVAHIAAYYGFDDYIGTQYHRNNSKFSGEVSAPSYDKKAALDALVEKHGLTFTDSYGIGDSKSDASMLALVEHPIAFNPDKNLFEIAKTHHWKIIIERKNMIYTLEPYDGHYILA